jgi:cation transport regulator ChaB
MYRISEQYYKEKLRDLPENKDLQLPGNADCSHSAAFVHAFRHVLTSDRRGRSVRAELANLPGSVC